MPPPATPYVVQTRQHIESFSFPKPEGSLVPALLPPGGTLTSNTVKSEGYNVVHVWALSPQAFTIDVLETNEPAGTLTRTKQLTSAVDPESLQQIIKESVPVKGSFMVIRVTNGLVQQTVFEIDCHFIPIGC